MALAEKHRSTIYAHFVATIGEEAAEAMMSQFPARDLDEPVTKEFVQLQVSDVRREIADLRTDMAELGNRLAVRLQVTVGVVGAIVAGLSLLGG